MEDFSSAGVMEEDAVAVAITPNKTWARKMPKKKRKLGRYVSHVKALTKKRSAVPENLPSCVVFLDLLLQNQK